MIAGVNAFDKDTIKAVVDKVFECDGASYGPWWDTVQMVLGALAEVQER